MFFFLGKTKLSQGKNYSMFVFLLGSSYMQKSFLALPEKFDFTNEYMKGHIFELRRKI